MCLSRAISLILQLLGCRVPNLEKSVILENNANETDKNSAWSTAITAGDMA